MSSASVLNDRTGCYEIHMYSYMGSSQVLSCELIKLSSCLLKDLVFSSGVLSSENSVTGARVLS